MKRNILGFVAVIIAVALSAFTAPQNQQLQNPQPNLFWYTIDSQGNLVGPLNDDPIDKDTEMLFSSCQDEIEVECLVGTTSNQDQGQSANVVNPGDDYHIRENFTR